MVEHSTLNRQVEGSSPSGSTNFYEFDKQVYLQEHLSFKTQFSIFKLSFSIRPCQYFFLLSFEIFL